MKNQRSTQRLTDEEWAARRRARGITAFRDVDERGREYFYVRNFESSGELEEDFDSLLRAREFAMSEGTFVRRVVDQEAERQRHERRIERRRQREMEQIEAAILEDAYAAADRYPEDHPFWDTLRGCRYEAAMSHAEIDAQS